MIKYLIKRFLTKLRCMFAGSRGSAAYWTVHMVPTEDFRTAKESLAFFEWRNSLYPGYIDLMPVKGHDGKVIVDYGCGPGNDVVGFSYYSNPERLIAIDVSITALEAARKRLALHEKVAEFVYVDEVANSLPIADNSVDLIHSSGVLHHCANLPAILKEFHRILRANGELQIMVYNYQSIWLHLYVAYFHQLEMGRYQGKSIAEAFRRTTDGEDCPIAHCYSPEQFLDLMSRNGFDGEFLGASISLTEMKVLQKRFDAIGDRRLAKEHRDFLSSLTFDERGIPRYLGAVAGIGACYKFTKRG